MLNAAIESINYPTMNKIPIIILPQTIPVGQKTTGFLCSQVLKRDYSL